MPDAIDIQKLARSCNELLILASLRQGRRHGYQIALEIEERSDGFFTFNHGTLYPILHHLETQGFIDGQWEGNGRRRKEYSLSVTGRAHLEARAAEWRIFHERLSAFVAADPGAAVRSRTAAGGS